MALSQGSRSARVARDLDRGIADKKVGPISQDYHLEFEQGKVSPQSDRVGRDLRYTNFVRRNESEMLGDPVDRAEEFIQLFNRIESFLLQLVKPQKFPRFWQLVDDASVLSAVVRANSGDLKRFGNLRNAIVHDSGYPSHIVAVPSEEALLKFKSIVHEVLEPNPLIPMFATQVRCFSPGDTLPEALGFMRKHDFSQVMVRRGDGRLSMLTVEGITKWLADDVAGNQSLANKVTLDRVLSLEPPGCFIIMDPEKTIFDAADAFRNSIHRKATRLYAIAITGNGGDAGETIGFVTPWDLVHNPRLR